MVISTPVRNNLNEDKINQFMDKHFYISVAIMQKEKQPLQ